MSHADPFTGRTDRLNGVASTKLLTGALPDLQTRTATMDGQVGQAVVAGGDVAGRAAGQPDNVAVGNSLLSVRCSDCAATGDDDEYDVQVRLGVGVHALTGREVDEVCVELATRL